MSTTTNYSFPKYDANDAPNLMGPYNSAMDAIDSALHSLSVGTGGADTYVNERRTAATTALDVSKLGADLYVDPTSGLVFYKPES